ncbi:Gfo/Idh/MocA family oxidoreductase [candidate division KSB1 bacterium]|nr:Gfo/Idh/MocA family oxidoreductase [candidate division KSB1 bacterium]
MNEQRQSQRLDRRNFLTLSVTAGAGLLLSSRTESQSLPAKNDDINVALLGVGSQGQVLLDACLKIPGLRFRAVCDIWTEYNQARAARILDKYGHKVNTYEDYRDMLNDEKELDAVIIATPDFWHADQTIDCMNAGLHVYCEKEMSNSLEKAKQMVQTARESGKLLQIGHQRRSNPRYIHCYDKLIQEAKILGRITTINAQWNRAVQPDLGWPRKYVLPPAVLKKYGYGSMTRFRNWRWYRNLGGGPIVDLGSHQIDIFNWFLGANPGSVFASGGTDYYDKATHQWYDSVMAIFEYKTKENIVRAFYQTLTTNSNQGYYENFMGDQGTLYISESAGRGGVYREQSAPDWQKWVNIEYINNPVEAKKPEDNVTLDVRETVAPPEYGIPVEFNDPYHKPHLENFFNTIRGKDTLNCPADAGYETAVTVLKVNQAVESGLKLKYEPNEFYI